MVRIYLRMSEEIDDTRNRIRVGWCHGSSVCKNGKKRDRSLNWAWHMPFWMGSCHFAFLVLLPPITFDPTTKNRVYSFITSSDYGCTWWLIKNFLYTQNIHKYDEKDDDAQYVKRKQRLQRQVNSALEYNSWTNHHTDVLLPSFWHDLHK